MSDHEHKDPNKIHPKRRNNQDGTDGKEIPQNHSYAGKLMGDELQAVAPELVRYDSGKQIKWAKWIIPASAAFTGGLVAFAAPSLINTSGIVGVIKMGALGGAAAFVSGVVNHHAITSGTLYAAQGLRIAGVVSLGAITITGAAALAFSYSGLVIDRVDQLNQSDHGQALSRYVNGVNENATQLYQLSPVVETIASGLQANINCEAGGGCLSGNGGGKGAIYRSLLPAAQRAQEIAKQLSSSDVERKNQLSDISAQLDEYYVLIGDKDLSEADRTRALLSKDSQIKQMVAKLRESMPLSLMQGYQAELSGGLQIVGYPEGTAKINGILERHGNTLRTTLEKIEQDESVSPDFPAKAGVSSAFSRFFHFWPIGILTAAIELIIPLTLWFLTYTGLVLQLFRSEREEALPKESN